MASNATYIADVLRARISSGQSLTAPTLEGLSKEFNVSFSPVRAAIAELVRQGWIIKAQNRRLVVNQGRIGCDPAHPRRNPPTRVDHAQLIADDLILASLCGQAVFVREEETAAHYGIGRTVVRRIFSELAGKRLLKHEPNRGWELRPFTEDDLDAFSKMREMIETEIIASCHEKFDPAILHRILDNNQVACAGSLTAVDDTLHMYFVETSNNRYFVDFFELHFPYFRFFFALENEEQIRADVARQHRAVLERLLVGNWRGARRALSQHLNYSHPLLRATIASLRSAKSDEVAKKIRSIIVDRATLPNLPRRP